MDIANTGEDKINKTGTVFGSDAPDSDDQQPFYQSRKDPDEASNSILDNGTVRRAVTSTGFRVSIDIKPEASAEPEYSALKPVKEEPAVESECRGCEIGDMNLDCPEMPEAKKESPRMTFDEFLEATNTKVMSPVHCQQLVDEMVAREEKSQQLEIKVKEEPQETAATEKPVTSVLGEVLSENDQRSVENSGVKEVKEEPKGLEITDTCLQVEVKSLNDQAPETSGVQEVKEEPKELAITVKEGPDVFKSEERKTGSKQPPTFPKSLKDSFEEYRAYTEGRTLESKPNREEPDLIVEEKSMIPFNSLSKSSKPKYVKKDPVRDTKVDGIVVEDGDFPEEADWYLVGRSMVTGLSTSKGRRLVDNEIIHFSFPSSNMKYNAQWIVRFSTKRSGEIGRLPMEWGKCVVPLVSSGKVKVLGRCVVAPPCLHIMDEIVLYISFYIHNSVFTQLEKSQIWKLEANSFTSSTIYPLLTLFNLLKIKPYKEPEFTPEELDSRKRSLNLEYNQDEAAALLPIAKRRQGCQQYPEQEKDEQAISESSLNKLVGAADTYNLEEMEPPSTLMCNLRPYQKQALYWMSESEKGIAVEKAAKTLHPCWGAYRICDERASSIFLNNFSGEATTQFPTATQMARGGILADAMGLGKTVMTIALLLSRPFKGSTYRPPNTNKQENAWPKAKGGTLIVCPMALLGQWKDELETHSQPETMSIFVHYGGLRTRDPKVISGYDVVLTTYGVLSAAYKSDLENSIFHKVDWYRVVLDEAHTIKNWKSLAAKATFLLSAHCRWCLTGTPIQNNLEDLYSLLCFLHVEPWCNWQWWQKLIQRPYENGDPRGLRLIKAILRPLMLRRTKETMDKQGRPILVLPPTDIQIIECEHTEAERHFYDALFRRSKVQFDQFVAQGKVLHNYANILELLLRLRQCCNHPYLVLSRADSQQYTDLDKLARRFLEPNADSDIPRKGGPSRAYVEEVVEGIRRGENNECPICMEYADDPVLTSCAHKMCRECILSSWRTPTTGLCPICRTLLKKTDLITCPTENKFRVDVVNNWRESSKVSTLLECLEQIRSSGSGEKSIVFSQWTSFLDLLEIPLSRKGIGFLRFDGKLVQKQRERVLKEFNETKEKMVLLMSLKAGGVGLNLTAASNVFLMDPWWNPAVEEQAIMRIHRIGQKRTVNVRRFIVKDTVEERLQQVQARKQRMISGALTDEEVRSARIEELKMLFR
ncbi:DNA repair protein RAD5B [Euphorbia lathyris]|uniref:DNA repair protein RAD5B n=1 Tax=Euphorbia lathyris TaxID=212925 RepID=UPI003314311E